MQMLLLELMQVNSVYLSVPESWRHQSSSVMLEVRLGTSSKLSVEGTVLAGVPQWTAVDGEEFCRPVVLGGHLLVGRAANASTNLQQLVDALRGRFIRTPRYAVVLCLCL